MSLLDRVRSTVHASRGTVDALRPQTPTWRVWASGAVAVGVPWLATIGMAVLVWAVTPASDAPWGQVLGIASAGWFLGTGADVAVDGVVVGIVPMLVWGLAAAFTAYQLRRLVAHTDERPLRLLPGFLGGYAAAAALVGLLTLAGPVRPTPAGLLGALSVPLVAAAVVALREDDDLFDRLPQWAARALRPAGWGVVTLAALAAALLLGMLVVRWPTLSSLDAAVGAHGAGEVGLIVGQLLFLPDLLVWALSFIAGPGFQVAAGGTVSVSGAAPGLLPMIPALGVVPSDGLYPAAVTLVLLLPLAAGALGRLARRTAVVPPGPVAGQGQHRHVRRRAGRPGRPRGGVAGQRSGRARRGWCTSVRSPGVGRGHARRARDRGGPHARGRRRPPSLGGLTWFIRAGRALR